GASGLTETSPPSSHYWSRWDIARDFAFLPDGSGGYVLDGFGGLHPFAVNGGAMPAAVQGAPYWPGWDIARRVVIMDDGKSGYILDGFGGVHAFGIGGPAPSNPTVSASWGGHDLSESIVVIPGTANGYVLDAYGGLHPFAAKGQAMPAAIVGNTTWPNWNVARGAWLLPGSPTAGYVLDAFGGLHPFGGAPALVNSPYWPNQYLAKMLLGA
ncbi:MAG TPA: hypothetical protein VFL90_01120, partial [Methylomirabilota bacterium]|nr:hypothetical protein [Methylomirabilota bacterium]